MTKKSNLLIALSAAALLVGASPAFAGAGGAAAAQQERGNRGGDNGNRGGDRGGNFNRGGDNGGQRDAGNRGGGNGGGWQNRVQAAPQQAAPRAAPQQVQRPGWANGGRNDNNNFQGRMREAQAGQQQARPDWANGRTQNRVQQQPAPQQRVQNQNRVGQNNGQQPNWRTDPRANRGLDNRNFGGNDNRNNSGGYNNVPRGPQNFGQYNSQNRNYSRNWNTRNDWARYDRRPRTQVNIRIGGFFGSSYGSIASRYYGQNYTWYGSRSWSSWNRPWRIGYVLPPAMYCEPLPYDLYFDLPPPPIGYDYIMCDGDILIVGEDSGVVYDAILPWY